MICTIRKPWWSRLIWPGGTGLVKVIGESMAVVSVNCRRGRKVKLKLVLVDDFFLEVREIV